MSKTVSVIVSQCVKGRKSTEGRAFGPRLLDHPFLSVEEAMQFVKVRQLSEDGYCVIVRPNYNEHDDTGSFIREWRSFNGEALKEVRFEIPFF